MANFLLMIPLLKKAEGGLSKSQSDPARFDPVPDGSGYHTNKGITWATFKNLASIIGYAATPDLFYAMPENIWRSILKVGYWDKVLGDKLHSQAIAEMIADAQFNGWYNASKPPVLAIQNYLNNKGYNLEPDGIIGTKTVTAINNYLSKYPAEEKTLVTLAAEARKKWYISLGGANLDGWINRVNELYSHVSQYFGIVKKNPVKTALVFSGIGIGIYFIVKKLMA